MHGLIFKVIAYIRFFEAECLLVYSPNLVLFTHTSFFHERTYIFFCYFSSSIIITIMHVTLICQIYTVPPVVTMYIVCILWRIKTLLTLCIL